MLNFGALKPKVKGGPGPRVPPLDPHLANSFFRYVAEFISLKSMPVLATLKSNL